MLSVLYHDGFVHLGPTALLWDAQHHSFSLTPTHHIKPSDLTTHHSTGFSVKPPNGKQQHAQINGVKAERYEWGPDDELATVRLYEDNTQRPYLIFDVFRPYEQLALTSGIKLKKDLYGGAYKLTLPSEEMVAYKIPFDMMKLGDQWREPQRLSCPQGTSSIGRQTSRSALCIVKNGRLIAAYALPRASLIQEREELAKLQNKLSAELTLEESAQIPHELSDYLNTLKPHLEPHYSPLADSKRSSDWVKLSLIIDLNILLHEAQQHGHTQLCHELDQLKLQVMREPIERAQANDACSPRSLLERLSPHLNRALTLEYNDERRPLLLSVCSAPWFTAALPSFKACSLKELELFIILFQEQQQAALNLISQIKSSGIGIEALTALIQREGVSALSALLGALDDLHPDCRRNMLTPSDLLEVYHELQAGPLLELNPFSVTHQRLRSQEERRQQLRQDVEAWRADLYTALSAPPVLPTLPSNTPPEELVACWAALTLPHDLSAQPPSASAQALMERYQTLVERSPYIAPHCDEQRLSIALKNVSVMSAFLEEANALLPLIECLYPGQRVELSLTLELTHQLTRDPQTSRALHEQLQALADLNQPLKNTLQGLEIERQKLSRQLLELISELPPHLTPPPPSRGDDPRALLSHLASYKQLKSSIINANHLYNIMESKNRQLNQELSKLTQAKLACPACAAPKQWPSCSCGWRHYVISAHTSLEERQALISDYRDMLKAHKTALWLKAIESPTP